MKKNAGNLSRSRVSGGSGSPAAIAQLCRRAVVREFDGSFISGVMLRARESIPYIRNRAIGIFLLTFGIYSALIVAFKAMFGFGGAMSDSFASIAVAVAAVPLLISKGTVYTMLSTSRTGRVIGNCIGIRLQAMGASASIGRANVAFLLGMLMGTLSFLWEAQYILGVCLAVGVCSVILVYPESSVVFAAALLPLGDGSMFTFIASVGILSFIIKLIRRKRYLSFTSHTKIALIFIGVVAFLGALAGNLQMALYAAMCAMIAVTDRNEERAGFASASVLVSCAVVASVYLAFRSLSYLSGMKADLAMFDISTLSVIGAAIVPVAVAMMIKGEIMPSRTAGLCLVSVVAFLLVTRSYIALTAAVISTVLLLFVYKRKVAYFFMAITGVGYAAWVWLGGSNRLAFDTFMGFLSEFNMEEKQGLSPVEMIYGEGLGKGAFSGDNFYEALVSGVGLVGVVILASALVILTVYIWRLKIGARDQADPDGFMLEAFAYMCSVFALLVCGAQMNIWSVESIYIMFWLMYSSAAAVALSKEKKARRYEYGCNKENSGVSADIVVSFANDKG